MKELNQGKLFKLSILGYYTKKQKKVSLLIGLATAAALLILSMLFIVIPEQLSPTVHGDMHSPDNWALDALMVKRAANSGGELKKVLSNPNSKKIVLLKIDQESLTELGMTWPIKRSTYAEILNFLNRYQAKTIGFDILFIEPSTPEEDRAFADALRQTDNVILAYNFYFRDDPVNYDKKILTPAYPVEILKNQLQNSQNAIHIGFVDLAADERLQLIELIKTTEDNTHYSFSLALLANFLDIPQEKIYWKKDGTLQFGERTIPVTKRGEMFVNYLLPAFEDEQQAHHMASLRHFIEELSLAELLRNPDEQRYQGLLKDSLVVIGVTAAAGEDIKLTPFGRMPGVYGHIQVILSIINNSFIRILPFFPSFIIVLALGILGGLIYPRLSPASGLLAAVAGCSAYFELTFRIFAASSLLYPVTIPLLTISLSYIGINLYHHLSETKTKESFSRMFREFAPVPTNLIEKYVEEYGGSAATGGELAHVTVLFSDIRGYTQMSESMSSQEVVALLNEFHTEMGKIFEETGGVIYTYIGDAQLVVYGHEGISRVNHAAAAVKAGLLMQEKMKELRSRLETNKKIPLEIGIGLCTGSVSVAVVGAAQRKQYTVIGDTVNIASRIQGMSRELNAPVLIHERTYLLAKHCIEADPILPVKLKGKSDLVYVFRAKNVNTITPYQGDEIKDLDKEQIEFRKTYQLSQGRLKINADEQTTPEKSKEHTPAEQPQKETADEKSIKETAAQKSKQDFTVENPKEDTEVIKSVIPPESEEKSKEETSEKNKPQENPTSENNETPRPAGVRSKKPREKKQ